MHGVMKLHVSDLPLAALLCKAQCAQVLHQLVERAMLSVETSGHHDVRDSLQHATFCYVSGDTAMNPGSTGENGSRVS